MSWKPCADAQTKIYVRFIYRIVVSIFKSNITMEDTYKECFCTWPNTLGFSSKVHGLSSGKSCQNHNAKTLCIRAPQSLCSACFAFQQWSPDASVWEVHSRSLLASTLMLPFPKRPERQRKCCKPSSCKSSMFLAPMTRRQFRQLWLSLATAFQQYRAKPPGGAALLCKTNTDSHRGIFWICQQIRYLILIASEKYFFQETIRLFEIIPFSTYMATRMKTPENLPKLVCNQACTG